MQQLALDDVSALAVFADALEETGDVHASIIRAALRGADTRQLIRENWTALFGTLAPQKPLIRWRNGLVEELSLRKPSDIDSLPGLVGHSSMRAVRRWGFEFAPDLAALEDQPALRELAVFATSADSLAPWTGCRLDSLETLTLQLRTMQGLEALASLSVPRLGLLDTGCDPDVEERLIETVGSTRWWASLRRWRHRPRSLGGLLALLRCRPLTDRDGEGLVALCPAALIDTVPPEVRSALPKARFELLREPQRRRDPEETHHSATPTVMPIWAPLHFRELPAQQTLTHENAQDPNGMHEEVIGSGVLQEPSNSSFFSGCGWCGEQRVSRIYSEFWTSYSHFETTKYRRWESECPSCKLFTNTGAVTY